VNRQHLIIAAAAAAVILAVLAGTSASLRARAKAQLDVSTGAGDDGPVSFGQPPLSTGVTPGRYPVHIPANAHLGRHRMYRHPGTCSPGLGAPAVVDYGWLFSPPSEGDL
jgi:hypothetical protein